mmetsp:Transcript_11062/g.26606  ORF Transcript_11062/g.26606 Transcript_11062/m.26606 type:complete len:346 (+) Transcript_11062:118-1155(+)|eukprot:732952-Rhodomonas_salina.1
MHLALTALTQHHLHQRRFAAGRSLVRVGAHNSGAEAALIEPHHLALDSAEHRAVPEAQQPLLKARHGRQVPEHPVGAVVLVLGHRRLEAMRQRHALHALDGEHMFGVQDEAVHRRARHRTHLREVSRERPRRAPRHADRMPRRDAQSRRQRNHLLSVAGTLGADGTDDASELARRGRDGVALLELFARHLGAVREVDQGVLVEARVVCVVEVAHAEAARVRLAVRGGRRPARRNRRRHGREDFIGGVPLSVEELAAIVGDALVLEVVATLLTVRHHERADVVGAPPLVEVRLRHRDFHLPLAVNIHAFLALGRPFVQEDIHSNLRQLDVASILENGHQELRELSS